MLNPRLSSGRNSHILIVIYTRINRSYRLHFKSTIIFHKHNNWCWGRFKTKFVGMLQFYIMSGRRLNHISICLVIVFIRRFNHFVLMVSIYKCFTTSSEKARAPMADSTPSGVVFAEGVTFIYSHLCSAICQRYVADKTYKNYRLFY